jgi:hypothetical protein
MAQADTVLCLNGDSTVCKWLQALQGHGWGLPWAAFNGDQCSSHLLMPRMIAAASPRCSSVITGTPRIDVRFA